MQADRVAQLLRCAVSPQEAERAGGEAELRQMETQDGFTKHLMALAACRDLDTHSRWLAVMYLKNQVGRFWQRRTGIPYEISDEEKTAVRAGCLPLSLDADDKIATQAALVVARIVRFDYPRVWNDAMPLIAQAVEQHMPAHPLADNAAGIQVTRVLHYCLKELGTKRLVHDRRAFFQVAPAFLSLMLQFWSLHHSSLSSFLSEAAAAHQTSSPCTPSPPGSHLLGFLLATKALRRILVTGFARLHTEVATLPILSTFVTALESYHSIFALALRPPACTSAASATYFLGKLIAEVMEQHPLALRNELERILSLIVANFQVPSVSLGEYEEERGGRSKGIRLVILRILKAAIREGAFAIRPQRSIGGGGAAGQCGGGEAEASAAAQEMVAAFVTGDRVAVLCSGVVLRALKMDTDEAEEILAQGLEALHAGAAEEDGQDEMASVAAECVASILRRAGETGVSALLALFAPGLVAAGTRVEAVTREGAMVREATYHALGAAAAQVIRIRGVGAAALAEELVTKEAANGDGGSCSELALKRCVWMVGRFVSADMEIEGSGEGCVGDGQALAGSQVSAKLVPLLCQLLASHPSLAVRVAAASSLTREGEEAGEMLAGGASHRSQNARQISAAMAAGDLPTLTQLLSPSKDTLRLPPTGDDMVSASALAEAASTLAEHGRAALNEGSDRLGVEAMQMSVRLLHGIAMRLRALDGGQDTAVPTVVLPHISRVLSAAGDQKRLMIMLTRMLSEMLTTELLISSSDAVCQLVDSAVTEQTLTDARSPAGAMSLVLLDAIVELWLKLVRAVSGLTSALIHLLPRAVALVAVPKGPREHVLRLIESYLLLASLSHPEIITSSVAPISAATQSAARNMTSLELRCALYVCEVALVLGPGDSWKSWGELLAVGAEEVLVRKTGGEALAASWFSCVAALTLRAAGSGDGWEAVKHLLSNLNDVNAASGGVILLTEEELLDRWVDAWDSLVSLERRRMCCVALLALLGAGVAPVAARVVSILSFVSEIVSEEVDEPDKPPRALTALQTARARFARETYANVPGGIAALVHEQIHQGRERLCAAHGHGAAAALDQELAQVDPLIMSNLHHLPRQA